MKLIYLITFMILTSTVEAVGIGDPIRASDISALKNAINTKRVCYGIGNWSWSDSGIAPGLNIRAFHIQEIRNAVNDLYVKCASGACAPIGLGNVNPANRTWTDSSLSGQPIKATHINELNNTINAITCVATTYNWDIGATTSCNGGSGTWVTSSWGTCSGGNTGWLTGAWSSCSESCGDGIQTRSASCEYGINSGTQTRTVNCNFNSNSGTASRTVICKRSDGAVVTDSWCSGAKPATIVNCTPTNPTVCGTMPPTNQACTPPGNPSCGAAPMTSQTCNVQPCPGNNCPAGYNLVIESDGFLLCCTPEIIASFSGSGACDACHFGSSSCVNIPAN
jgi:hypothetical protein